MIERVKTFLGVALAIVLAIPLLPGAGMLIVMAALADLDDKD